MNSKGQTFLIGIMLAALVFVLALAFAPTLKLSTEDGLGQASCSAPANKFIAGFCVLYDAMTPAFTGFLLAVAAILLAAKVLL